MQNLSQFSQNNNSNIYTILSQNLHSIMKKRNLSQLSIVDLCKDQGLKISQGTISHVLNRRGNVTLDTISSLAAVLNVDINTLLTPYSPIDSNVIDNSCFITKPDDPAFRGYLGTFSLYFYQTHGKENHLLHGTLTFKASDDGNDCIAFLTIPINEEKKGTVLQKEYKGNVIISKQLRSVYVFLYDDNCDISVLVFHHRYIPDHTLKCVMASAITTSADSNHRPTIHRACIVKDAINSEMLPYIMGQLLMNDSDILISDSELNKLLVSPDISPAFKDLLKKATSKESYHLLKENLLIDNTSFNEHDNLKLISHLRTKSTSSRYNKISKRTDDTLFTLLYKKD